MAEKTITNAEALADAIAIITTATPNHPIEEVIAKLQRMYDVATKPRKSNGEPSKETLMRQNFAREVVEKMRAHGAPVSTKWLMTITGITTSQKATGVMTTAKKLGLVVSEKTKDGVMYSVCE